MDKAKIEVIQKLPLPATIRDLRSFLGHVSFYRRFIQDFVKSLQATHHPSLQRQRLHHRRRRVACIRDAEASTNRGTNSSKSKLGLTIRDHVRRFGLHKGSGLVATIR